MIGTYATARPAYTAYRTGSSRKATSISLGSGHWIAASWAVSGAPCPVEVAMAVAM